MKAWTGEERPGHQKSLSSRALVLKHPACPVVGESCMKQVMACRSCGGMYMLCELTDLRQGQGLLTLREVLTKRHCILKARLGL